MKKFLIVLIVIVLIIVAVIAGAYLFVNGKINKVNHVDIDESSIEINEGVKETLKEYRNIAILGIDSAVDDYGLGNRSDGIIIASIDQETNEIKLTSVYRDTYLDIPGRGLDKINHAYCYGGPELALSALNTNMDLNITEFIVINFNTVADAVNSVGGVEINITSDELKYINSYIKGTEERTGMDSNQITKTGKQTLDGIQAMAYSRIRYTEGLDYKRTERMRTVLEGVFGKLKGKSMGELLSFADKILPELETNIKTSEIMSMIPNATKYKVIASIGWPYDTKGYDTSGPWYGPPVTLESNLIRLHKEVFGEENYVPSEKVKEINQKIIDKTGYTKM